MRAFKSYDIMLHWINAGRSPEKGRQFNSSIRLFKRDGFIEIQNHGGAVAHMYPDDVVEFVLPPGAICSSLTQQLPKVVPVNLENFDTGRYKVVAHKAINNITLPLKYTSGEYTEYHNKRATLRREAQEYFQHLKLDLKTGQVINPKDMTPEVDTEKRKQWLAGLKSFRLRLRTMARVGALDSYISEANSRYNTFFSNDELELIANAIMSGEVSADVAKLLCYGTSRWKLRRTNNPSEAVIGTFENLVKSNSRELRLRVGVISMKD
jgi:hypothetical protein